MSAYRDALDQTVASIQRRARRFRYQILSVGMVLAAATLLALVARSIVPLTLGLTLIPLIGTFLFADAAVVNDWCSRLLGAWTKRQLDFAAFRDSIRAHPMLPAQTLEAMLATLPSAGTLPDEQALSVPTREAVAAAVTARQSDRAEVLLGKVVASAIVVVAAIGAVWSSRWWPLLAVLLVGILPLVRRWRVRQRLTQYEADVRRCRAQPGFSDEDYTRLVATVKY